MLPDDVPLVRALQMTAAAAARRPAVAADSANPADLEDANDEPGRGGPDDNFAGADQHQPPGDRTALGRDGYDTADQGPELCTK